MQEKARFYSWQPNIFYLAEIFPYIKKHSVLFLVAASYTERDIADYFGETNEKPLGKT